MSGDSGMRLLRMMLWACLPLCPSVRAADAGMLFLMQDYPPFVVNDGGRASGPYVDIVLRACAPAGCWAGTAR